MINFEKASVSTIKAFEKCFRIIPEFISIQEHDLLIKQCHSALAKATWCGNHFDSVISNYRETTVSNCTSRFPQISNLWNQMKSLGYIDMNVIAMDPHILELASNGRIDHHIDTVRYFY